MISIWVSITPGGVVATSNFSSIATLVSASKVMLCPWK